MTPAITALKKRGVHHEVRRYELSDTDERTYGEAVAAAIGMVPERVFKTLVAELDTRELVVAVVPVTGALDLRALATAAGVKRAAMADRARAEKATGYVIGGISPFGQRQRLRAFIDASARDHPTVCVSAGKRGLQVEVRPEDLLAAVEATAVALMG